MKKNRLFISNKCPHCTTVLEAINKEQFEIYSVKPMRMVGKDDEIGLAIYDNKHNRMQIIPHNKLPGVPALLDKGKLIIGTEIIEYLRENKKELLKENIIN